MRKQVPAQKTRDISSFRGLFGGLILLGVLAAVIISGQFLGLTTWRNLNHRFLPCQLPITYSIGEFDDRFDVSEQEFSAAVLAAEELWEQAIDKNLFASKPKGELTINLKYDYRQAGTDRLNELGLNIQTNNTSYEALKTEYDSTYQLYLDQQIELDQLLSEHETRAAAYENEVARTNAAGGATPKEYRALQSERKALNAESTEINSKVKVINTTADDVNALADALNDLADKLNLTAARYNKIGASLGDEFVEGTFGASNHGDEINIYQFEDQAQLIRVLAHELGHALGLDHVNDPEAIMYRLNESENASLTTADVSALKELCRVD